MRQGQQNRRGRGRPNNSRSGKGQNPLTRSQESNGPDVKIRGTASHIAEKYISLARDSLSSGDIVMAENYLQHAEHYNRIIMTYREQQQPGENGHGNNGHSRKGDGGRHAEGHQGGQNFASRADDGGNDAADAGAGAEAAIRGDEPQPRITDHNPGDSRTAGRAGRGPRDDGRSRRPQRGGRGARSDPAGNGEDNPRGNAPARQRGSNEASPSGNAARKSSGPKSRDGSGISDGQEAPGFLRNPVAPTRRQARGKVEPEPAAPAVAPVGEEDGV